MGVDGLWLGASWGLGACRWWMQVRIVRLMLRAAVRMLPSRARSHGNVRRKGVMLGVPSHRFGSPQYTSQRFVGVLLPTSDAARRTRILLAAAPITPHTHHHHHRHHTPPPPPGRPINSVCFQRRMDAQGHMGPNFVCSLNAVTGNH